MSAAPKLSHYEDDLVREHNNTLRWLIGGILTIALINATALVLVMRQPRNRPYVLTIAPNGEVLDEVKPLAGDPVTMQDAVIKWAAMRFVKNWRTVSPDIAIQKGLLWETYAFAKHQARAYLDTYYHDQRVVRDPFKIATKSWIEVSDIGILKFPAVGPDVYQATWIETRTDFNSPTTQTTKWRATLKIVSDEPGDRNPMGIYIEDIDSAEESQQ